MSSEDIIKKIEQLECEKEQLKKQKKQALIDEGKAFKCGGCSKIVVVEDATSAENNRGLCWSCLRRKKREEKKEEILKKIYSAKIVDISIEEGWTSLVKSLVVYKKGMMYELKAMEDEGNAWFQLDREWKDKPKKDIIVERPGMKKRPKSEKKLFEMKKC